MDRQEKSGRVQTNGSQEDVIRDPQGNALGYVSENGFVYDGHRTLLGYVSERGIVRDVALRIVGQVNVRETFPFSAGRAAFFLLKQPEQ